MRSVQPLNQNISDKINVVEVIELCTSFTKKYIVWRQIMSVMKIPTGFSFFPLNKLKEKFPPCKNKISGLSTKIQQTKIAITKI